MLQVKEDAIFAQVLVNFGIEMYLSMVWLVVDGKTRHDNVERLLDVKGFYPGRGREVRIDDRHPLIRADLLPQRLQHRF